MNEVIKLIVSDDLKMLVTSSRKQSTDSWGIGIILHDPRTNKILLAKRTDNGMYGSPGGKVEIGETPAEGIIRECKEESNVTINSMICYGYFPHTDPLGRSWTSFQFYSNDFDAVSLINQQSEMEQFSWYTIPDALQMDLFPPCKIALSNALDEGIISEIAPVDISDTVVQGSKYIPFMECPTSASQIMDSPPCQYTWTEPEKVFTTHQWLPWD